MRPHPLLLPAFAAVASAGCAIWKSIGEHILAQPLLGTKITKGGEIDKVEKRWDDGDAVSQAVMPDSALVPDVAALRVGMAIRGAETCEDCEGVLKMLKELSAQGGAALVETLAMICVLGMGEDEDVCTGLMVRQGPIIAHQLRKLPPTSNAAHIFCITTLGICPYPDITPWTVPFPSSSPNTTTAATAAATTATQPAEAAPRKKKGDKAFRVGPIKPVKPSNKQPEPQKKRRKTLKIVHYTDLHIDPHYLEGSNTNCTKRICCRAWTPDEAPGSRLSEKNPAGPFGNHACDTPRSLEASMHAAIAAVAPDAAFSIFTGDVVDRAVWTTTPVKNAQQIANAYAHMGGLVYGTIGNHEASPANAFPTLRQEVSVGPTAGQGVRWVYDILATWWTRRGVSSEKAMRQMGVYSARHPGIRGKLRVISINTNMYYTSNFWLYQDPMERDPNGQFAWLVNELDKAEKAEERVYIIGHMPMGGRDVFRDASNYFDQIVNRYKGTIAAMFFGHTHRDHFQLTYLTSATPSAYSAAAISYIAPALTPSSGAPAFRVYTVDAATFAVLDIDTYTATLPPFNPNHLPGFPTNPAWTHAYSARNAYGPLVSPALKPGAPLSPGWWHQLTVALERNATAFSEFFARRTRGFRVPVCDDECVRLQICGLRAARAQDNCVVPKKGVGLGMERVIDLTGGSSKVDEEDDVDEEEKKKGGDEGKKTEGEGEKKGKDVKGKGRAGDLPADERKAKVLDRRRRNHHDDDHECGPSIMRETLGSLARRDMIELLAADIAKHRARRAAK